MALLVLGLIFLKSNSDSFEERRAKLERLSRDQASDLYVKNDEQRERLLEDKDEYAAVDGFWVPPKARWSELQSNAKKPHIAQVIDAAMDAIERANPRLRGVLPADYEGRLQPRQSAVQRLRLVRPPPARRPALAARHPTAVQGHLRLDSALALPPGPHRHSPLRHSQRP